jgi:hypothetical protein
MSLKFNLGWVWLAGLLGSILFFTGTEWWALAHPDANGHSDTLSFFIAEIGFKFPLAIWICGVFSGALAVHFFSNGWAMTPYTPGSKENG